MYDLSGPEKTVKHLQEALAAGDLKPEDFSIREVAEATLSGERVRQMDPRSGGVAILEAGSGVDVTAFSNITGQIIRSKILEAYQQEAFVVSKLVDTIPTRLDGERIPGVGRIGDQVAEVQPGMPYPNLGFGEDYIDTPQTAKHGFIVPVTKEAIFFDRTHLILQRAAEVGEVLGLNKEKRLIDLVIGATNNYKWKGVSYNTYSATGSGAAPDGSWINQIDQELCDWTDVDAAEQLFADILDPNTGEPVLIQATTVLVMPAYRHAAHRVFNAAEITYDTDRRRTSPPRPPIRWATTAWPKAGWPTAGSWPPGKPPRPRKNGGSSAISARPSPTWRTGRSRSRNRPSAARPNSTRTSSSASKPANAAPRRSSIPRYVVKSTGTSGA